MEEEEGNKCSFISVYFRHIDTVFHWTECQWEEFFTFLLALSCLKLANQPVNRTQQRDVSETLSGFAKSVKPWKNNLPKVRGKKKFEPRSFESCKKAAECFFDPR